MNNKKITFDDIISSEYLQGFSNPEKAIAYGLIFNLTMDEISEINEDDDIYQWGGYAGYLIVDELDVEDYKTKAIDNYLDNEIKNELTQPEFINFIDRVRFHNDCSGDSHQHWLGQNGYETHIVNGTLYYCFKQN